MKPTTTAVMLSVGLCYLCPRACLAFHARIPIVQAPVREHVAPLSPTATSCAAAPHAGEVGDERLVWLENFELDSRGKVMLKGLLFSETEQLMENLGEKPGRAEVLYGWLYHDRRLIRDIAEIAGGGDEHGTESENNSNNTNINIRATQAKNRMGRKTREALGHVATADGGLELEDVQLAADGTRKLVSVLTSGKGAGKKVETVIIPMLRGPQREPRYTVCVSSQVGCAMNCQFCYTGRLGLMANLQAAQIVEQVLVAKRFLESVGDPAPVTGVVFMGMGEPFDNYDRVMRAVKVLTDPRAGVRLKASSVTVSTVGLVPQIERFCEDAGNGASLAISLHAVTDEIRDKLIPVNRRYPLAQLSETLRMHFPRISKPKSKSYSPESSAPFATAASEEEAANLVVAAEQGEKQIEVAEQLSPTSDARGELRPTHHDEAKRPRRGRRKSRILAVEYTLLGGVNDSLEDADRLADWLRGVACVVNLITFNTHEGTPFSSSSLEASEDFRQSLTARGQLCTFRDSRGGDGMAACGQLGGESMVGSGDRARKPVPVAWEPPSTAQAA